jgi:hypothetical protein
VNRGGRIYGCAGSTVKVEGRILPKRWLAILIILGFSICVSLNLFAVDQFTQPTMLKELLSLSPPDLEKVDLARMNLLCADGLRGSEI